MDTLVRYRLAQPSDSEGIGIQGRAAFLEAFGEEYTQAEVDGYFAVTYGLQLQDAEIAEPANRIFLAEDDRGLVGHLKLGPCNLPEVTTFPTAEVKRFYVLGRAQGTGVARTLLAMGVEAAQDQGYRSVALSCWTGNHRALSFYRREGFEVVGRQSFSVGPRVDEDFVMERPI